MKEMIPIILMMSLVSVSCNKSGGGSAGKSSEASTNTVTVDSGSTDTGNTRDTGDTTTDPVVVVPDPTPVANVPALALSFQTNVDLLNFDSEQAAKYNEAIRIVKAVVGTEEFRNQVINFTWNGTRQFANNNGLSNEQIYQSILDAAEKLKPIKNNTMDLGVELYYENSNTVGYTNSGTTQIWVNTKYFNQYLPNSVAGNLTHEWLHKLGYSHDSWATAQRPYSVPYAIGYIMGNIGKKFL